MNTIACITDQRRELVRAKTQLNGLDYLEVSCDRLLRRSYLTIYFLGKAPGHLTVNNFAITGGRRVRDIRITDISIFRDPDAENDDYVTLTVNSWGDFSTYRLSLVNMDEPIDPFYDHLDFTFKLDCPSQLDCKVTANCATETGENPDINYLAKDYSTFRQLILDRLALVMPGWKERHIPDIGIALAEVLAYVGDYLSYYQDAVATEAYLDTARLRVSVRRHARLVDYRMHEGCNARAWVRVQVADTAESVNLDPRDICFVTSLDDDMPFVLQREDLLKYAKSSYEVFEPLVAGPEQQLTFRSAHNRIKFYTWGERYCCLVKGSTRATLLDEWADAAPEATEGSKPDSTPSKTMVVDPGSARKRKLDLKPGDVLIFSETRGPETGQDADADPTRRWAVRLTGVTPSTDLLDDTPIVEITWSNEDALPFTFRISSISDSDHGCVYHDDVSVVFGNIVLADHGMSVAEIPVPGEVPTAGTTTECRCEGIPGDVTYSAGSYRPRLSSRPLTFRQSPDFSASACKMMAQEPEKAMPLVSLTGSLKRDPNHMDVSWEPRLDLLDSGLNDAHFVVETDNEGNAGIRFGDGECGRVPDAGMCFSAKYRFGNGTPGNIGAGTISHLVYGKSKPDGIDKVCNPLPASGGVDAEPISRAKLLAPTAFREKLQRAITSDDYAQIAGRDARLQRAAASLRWNGSWYEARVAVDPLGGEEPPDTLLLDIERELYPFRRMGHGLRIVAAEYVPILVAMNVCVKPGYLRGHVMAALLDTFSARIMADGKKGFFHPDMLSFGDGVFASRLIAAAQSVEGVKCASLTRLERFDEGDNHELENCALEIGPLQIARCDSDPDFPEHGRFDLMVDGGR